MAIGVVATLMGFQSRGAVPGRRGLGDPVAAGATNGNEGLSRSEVANQPSRTPEDHPESVGSMMRASPRVRPSDLIEVLGLPAICQLGGDEFGAPTTQNGWHPNGPPTRWLSQKELKERPGDAPRTPPT